VGRIRTSFIKKVARELYEKHKEKFSDDFEKNKKIVEELAEIKSKKVRNVVAGYITKLMKRRE